jgi:hypothetical protein
VAVDGTGGSLMDPDFDARFVENSGVASWAVCEHLALYATSNTSDIKHPYIQCIEKKALLIVSEKTPRERMEKRTYN